MDIVPGIGSSDPSGFDVWSANNRKAISRSCIGREVVSPSLRRGSPEKKGKSPVVGYKKPREQALMREVGMMKEREQVQA
eukprot:gene9643-3063_t